MKLSFIVLAHGYPLQLKRLIGRLAAPNTRVYLHVDRGTPAEVHTDMRRALPDIANLTWLKRRYSRWGSFGQVTAMLAGLEAAVAGCADHVIFLSGQDYPIQPLAALEHLLAEHTGTSFMEHRPLPSGGWPREGAARITRWHLRLDRLFFRRQVGLERWLSVLLDRLSPRRPLPLGLAAYGGSNWLGLHAEAARYVLDYARAHPAVIRFFKFVRLPDEAFFQTILCNSPLRSTLRDWALTYSAWNGPPFPRVLGLEEFTALAASGKFFARKFDPALSAGLMDRIDAELL